MKKKTLAEKPPQQLEGLATVQEACDYLSISRAKLYGMMDGGELPFVKLGACRRIPWRKLHDLIEQHTVNA